MPLAKAAGAVDELVVLDKGSRAQLLINRVISISSPSAATAFSAINFALRPLRDEEIVYAMNTAIGSYVLGDGNAIMVTARLHENAV